MSGIEVNKKWKSWRGSSDEAAKMRSEYLAMRNKYNQLSEELHTMKTKGRSLIDSAVKSVCEKFTSAIGECFVADSLDLT